MDLTDAYIKMCEKATEIQNLYSSFPLQETKDAFNWYGVPFIWEAQVKATPSMISSVTWEEGEKVVKYFYRDNLYTDSYECFCKMYKVWLPRQDQLQEMVRYTKTSWQLTQSFWNWLWKKEQVASDKSMEQLWLAFVMKEKYHKTWNGDDWIKIDEK